MAKPSFQFIFDFDGTLTKKDTLHLVSQVGYRKQHAISPGKALTPWQNIVDAYIADYETHATTYRPQPSERKDILSEAAWLNSLQDIETTSANRAIHAGIFNDVTMQDVETAAAEAVKTNNVELRPGWAELLSRIEIVNAQKTTEPTNPPTPLQILSVNWSRWFIWAVIWHSTSYHHSLEKTPTLQSRVQTALHTMSIFSNEIDSIATSSSSGSSRPTSLPTPHGHPTTIRTAGDKLKHMMESQSQSQSQQQQKPLLIYLGDSPTDLQCLIMADVGICVRNQQMGSSQRDLEDTAERLGIKVKHLDEYEHEGSRRCRSTRVSTLEELREMMAKGGTEKVIYYVYDFYEVERWVVRVAAAGDGGGGGGGEEV